MVRKLAACGRAALLRPGLLGHPQGATRCTEGELGPACSLSAVTTADSCSKSPRNESRVENFGDFPMFRGRSPLKNESAWVEPPNFRILALCGQTMQSPGAYLKGGEELPRVRVGRSRRVARLPRAATRHPASCRLPAEPGLGMVSRGAFLPRSWDTVQTVIVSFDSKVFARVVTLWMRCAALASSFPPFLGPPSVGERRSGRESGGRLLGQGAAGAQRGLAPFSLGALVFFVVSSRCLSSDCSIACQFL